MNIITNTLALLFAVQALTASASSGFFKNEWLDGHNELRLKYQTTLNKKEVVNVQWSQGLANLAKTWATGNAALCKNRAGNDGGYGRNGSMRAGTTTTLTPDWALQKWELTKSLGYPANGALTQAIWRPTEYIGCYIAANATSATGKPCSAAVCYYAKPGNCNMGGASGNTLAANQVWRKKTFADDSGCTPACPPDGCKDGSTGSTPSTKKPSIKKPSTKKPSKKPSKKPITMDPKM